MIREWVHMAVDWLWDYSFEIVCLVLAIATVLLVALW